MLFTQGRNSLQMSTGYCVNDTKLTIFHDKNNLVLFFLKKNKVIKIITEASM